MLTQSLKYYMTFHNRLSEVSCPEVESHRERPEEAREALVKFVGVSKHQDQRCHELQQGDCDEGGCRGRGETHKRQEGDDLKGENTKS